VIPSVSAPRIEPGGECRKCGAPAERYTWTFNANAVHTQYRCVAGHLYCADDGD
jgi:hypothetical protein